MSRFKDSWEKAKMLLSQLLCIGAVFTACTDDEVVNQADTAPLQVSVNTSLAKQSRAIVHGKWLPSGSIIGVSLFDTEGDDYDGQGYYNIQYKATGVEEDQVWSSMGVAPAVSANEAVLVAYHPYNDDEDLDITAIPVEIVSQTDYMYSGPVTGITNAAQRPTSFLTMRSLLSVSSSYWVTLQAMLVFLKSLWLLRHWLLQLH